MALTRSLELLRDLTRDELKTLLAEIRSRLAETREFHGGRPRSEDRCDCGRFTRSYAARHGHKCPMKGGATV